MRFWTKWPYWVRGGVTAFFISVAIIALTLFFNLLDNHGGWKGQGIISYVFIAIGFVSIITFFLIEFPGSEIQEILFRFRSGHSPKDIVIGYSTLIIGLIFWTILGMLIGWLYGKIKNRNKIKTPNA